MKQINQTGPLKATYFLIENAGEYETAILEYLVVNEHDPKVWGMRNGFNLDELVTSHRVKGNRESKSHAYPYVLCINLDDEYNQLIVNFVPAVAFSRSGDIVKTHLYEFRIKRTDLDSPYRVRESDYQIPAKDLFEAHLKLGQVYNDHDRYELEVLSWKQVK